jgi:hypothetical protein
MIVVSEGSHLLLVTQNDHARLAAEIVELWRADGLPGHPRRADLLFAVREHDNGWRETDSAPHCDVERGRPHDFLTLPREERIELWERGVSRYAGERPYAALLITHHARQLHQGRRGQEEWKSFLERLDERERELLEAAGASEEEVGADYCWLDVADQLSLVACNRWREPFERRGIRGRLEGDTALDILDVLDVPDVLRLDPFPLAGATTFRIPCRAIPDRRYRGDADLGGEMAAARWTERALKVAPFSSAP